MLSEKPNICQLWEGAQETTYRLPAAGVGDTVMATVKNGKPGLRKKACAAVGI